MTAIPDVQHYVKVEDLSKLSGGSVLVASIYLEPMSYKCHFCDFWFWLTFKMVGIVHIKVEIKIVNITW